MSSRRCRCAKWVLSVPKRLRWYLEREPKAVSAVLHILLRVIEAHVRQTTPGASPQARIGAVSFVYRFGSLLNRHIHFHCCILDGAFEPLEGGQVRFLHAQALTSQEVAAIAARVRYRVLRWFARSALLDADDVRAMLAWDSGGFSLDAAVRISGHDRAGLERLLRYCARPPFALERLEQLEAQRLIYHLPKLQRNGRTALSLTPLELLDQLAALIPPPCLHRHRYHGLLAPNSPLRTAATAYGREEASNAEQPPPAAASPFLLALPAPPSASKIAVQRTDGRPTRLDWRPTQACLLVLLVRFPLYPPVGRLNFLAACRTYRVTYCFGGTLSRTRIILN